MKVTPMFIGLFLHIHTSPEEFDIPDTITRQRCLEEMEAKDLIKQNDKWEHGYLLTERGEAWLKMLLSTPLPRKVYLDPQGKEIGDAYEQTDVRT